jgi:hypothetical protein
MATLSGCGLAAFGIGLLLAASAMQEGINRRNLSGTSITFTDKTGKKVTGRLSKEESRALEKDPSTINRIMR